MFNYSWLKFHEGWNSHGDVSNRHQVHNFRNSILKIPKSGHLHLITVTSKVHRKPVSSIVTRRALRYLDTNLYSFTKHYVTYAQNEMRIGSGLENNASEPDQRSELPVQATTKQILESAGEWWYVGCPHHSSMVESPEFLADPTFLHNCCSAINTEDLKSVFVTFSLFSAVLANTIEKIINC